jgi:cell division initiation protein
MPMLPLDIQQQRFRVRFGGGLDRTEVEAFVLQVAREVEELRRANDELRTRDRELTHRVDELRGREDAVRETMLTAQRVTDDVKRQAQKEADIIIGRAELDAERLLEAAQARVTELLQDISELKRQRAQFLSQVKSTVDAHQSLLEVATDAERERKFEENLAMMRRRAKTPPPGQTG